MKSHTNLLLISLFLAACAASNTEAPTRVATFDEVSPETVGLMQDSLDQILPLLSSAIDSQWISGAVVLVSRNGKVAYHTAIGYSDRAKQNAMSKDHIFRLASMTKPITSACIMQLYEQGKLDLEDPVSQYIPEYADVQVIDDFNKEDSSYTTRPPGRPITLHHLLTHTSGMPYGVFHPVAGATYGAFDVNEGWTTEALVLEQNIAKMAARPLMHDPGEAFTYGTNIDVLGRVVEVVSGMPLDEYMRQNIFDPLGMDDTWFYLPEEKAGRLVDVWHTPGYEPGDDAISGEDYPISGAKTLFMGGAGLSGTAHDYFLFCDAMRQGGARDGAKILKDETVELMTQNQIDTLQLSDGLRFGYGFAVWEETQEWQRDPGSYHWGGYWGTSFWVDPAQDMIVVLQTNVMVGQGDKFMQRFEEIVNNAVVEEEAVAVR